MSLVQTNILTSIPYGANAMHLALEARAHGAKNFYLSGSAGGINTHDKNMEVGDLAVPTVFLDRDDGASAAQIKNYFSDLSSRPGLVKDCRHRVVGHITEEDRSWLVRQVETDVNLVDVELGMVPFATDIGEDSKIDKTKLGVIGVVTDVPNRENFHKLKTEVSEKEKIARACALRDKIILEAMIGDRAEPFDHFEAAWFWKQEDVEKGVQLPEKIEVLKATDLRKYTEVKRIYLALLEEADLHGNESMTSLLATLALEKWESRRAVADAEKVVLEAKKNRLTKMFKGEMAKDLFNEMRSDQENHPELGAIVVVRMDADAFKQINDVLNHAAGDRQLVDIGLSLREEFAKIFGQQTRPTDVIVHHSGDEFGMIFSGVREYVDPETGVKLTIEQAAEKLIGRIVKKVEGTVRRPENAGGGFQTMSVGYKIIRPGEEVVDFESIDALADEASNVAKCLRSLEREGMDFSLGQNRIINFDKRKETLDELGVDEHKLEALKFMRALTRPVAELTKYLDPDTEAAVRERLREVLELLKKRKDDWYPEI